MWKDKSDLEEKIKDAYSLLGDFTFRGINAVFAAFALVIMIVIGTLIIFGLIGSRMPATESGVDTIFTPGFIKCVVVGILCGLPFVASSFLFLHICRIAVFKGGVFGIVLLIGLVTFFGIVGLILRI